MLPLYSVASGKTFQKKGNGIRLGYMQVYTGVFTMAKAKKSQGMFIKTDAETARMAHVLRTSHAVNVSQLLRLAIADAFHKLEEERKK
jgi:hypothetical protein